MSDTKQVDGSNLGAVWERVALLIRTLIGDVDLSKGNLQEQINAQVYPDMVGATADAAGSSGLVPAPAAGQQEMFLRADGTWAAASGGYIVFPELTLDPVTMQLIADGGEGIDLMLDSGGNLVAEIL